MVNQTETQAFRSIILAVFALLVAADRSAAAEPITINLWPGKPPGEPSIRKAFAAALPAPYRRRIARPNIGALIFPTGWSTMEDDS